MSPESYGPAYDKHADKERLKRQADIIRDYMLMVGYKTLAEIASATRFPEASISAQLRHLANKKRGKHDKDKRRRGGAGGTWEYILRPRKETQPDLPYEDTALPAGAA